MKKTLLLLTFLISTLSLSAQKYKLDTISYNGNIQERINLIILGDGYLATEMSKFKNDANNFRTGLFNQTPFKEYQNYFNVFAIETPSPESGIKHPHTASDCGNEVPISNPTNVFGTTFDAYGIHRLIVPMDYSAVYNVLYSAFPEYDIVVILANTTYYGGSGGSFATTSLNISANEIAIHELGHSFAGLADEYWAGPQYAIEKPNMTRQSNPSLIKWKNWLNTNGVGIYPHTGDASWFKPHTNCKMQILGSPFCNVCEEAIVEKIHSLASPLLNYSPSSSEINAENKTIDFTLNLLKPSPNTLQIKWVFDNSLVSLNTDEFTLSPDKLTSGKHTLSVSVYDTTTLSRSDNHTSAHLYQVTWTINQLITNTSITASMQELDIQVYPNPFSKDLFINVSLENEAVINVDVTDISGKKINLIRENQSGGSFTKKVRMEDLKSGIYLLSFSLNDQVIFLKKIVKE